MNEFEVIEKYFRSGAMPQVEGTRLGNGDDCALLDLAADETLAVSVDTVVEGVHFPQGADGDQVAGRALRTALSDLAAMGVHPRWVTLSLVMPELNERWLDDFSRTFIQDCCDFGCELVGGDTTRGPLVVSVQVMGAAKRDQVLSRRGARVGDSVYVTGTVGNGGAGLAAVTGKLDLPATEEEWLKEYFYSPPLVFEQIDCLRQVASSAVDISDGLYADLGHICKASEVGAQINLADLPFSSAARSAASFLCASAKQPSNADDPVAELLIRWALTGGDDYQLCFTGEHEKVQPLIDAGELRATRVGRVTLGADVTLLTAAGETLSNLEQSGYSHF